MTGACESLQSHILKLFLSGFATGKWFEGFGGNLGFLERCRIPLPRSLPEEDRSVLKTLCLVILSAWQMLFCLPAFLNKLEHANKGSLNTPTHYLTLNLSVFDVHTCAMALMHTYACTHTNIQMNFLKTVSRIPFHAYVFVLNFITQNREIAGLSHASW